MARGIVMEMAEDTGDQISLRPMTHADIPLGLRLSTTAGWNQTVADWQMLLSAGFGFVATLEGTDVGTATVVPYGTAFSWIGMVLVDPAYRRCGVGTALLDRAIADAQPYGCVRLDATPQGAPLYARLGFRVEYGLLRMVRPAGAPSSMVPDESAGVGEAQMCRPLDPADQSALVTFDASTFGAARPGILDALARNASRYAFSWREGDSLQGYCLGRTGAVYEQIGPVVADSEEAARALLLRALAVSGTRPAVVDVPDARSTWVGFLKELGFQIQRPFTRMVLGCVPQADPPARLYAIAGPEIG